jgi:hypothetical protein
MGSRAASGAATFAAMVAASILVDGPARADDAPPPDAKQTCIAAAERGQGQRDDGKYRSARQAFVECSQDTCPRVVQQSCTKWLRELDESAPTVVLGAKDDHGTDLTDVTVTLDGEPFATVLDGKPVPIDTGPHVLRFAREGSAPVEQKLVVRAGERARVVSVTLGAGNGEANPEKAAGEEEKPPPEAILSPHHVTTAAIVMGAIAAGGTGLAFFLQSKSSQSNANGLQASGPLANNPSACSNSSGPPTCALLKNDRNSQQTDMNVATGLFVGAGALLAGAVATWFIWPKPHASEHPTEPTPSESPGDSPPEKPAEPPPAEPQTTGSIVPTRGGAFLFLSRSF